MHVCLGVCLFFAACTCILTLRSAMESSDKVNIFEVDDSNVSFSKSGSVSTGCCARCVRMTLVFIPTVLSILCLVGVVVFGVLYYQFTENRIASLQNDQYSSLIAHLNSTQSMLQMMSTSQRVTYVRWGNSSCPPTNGASLVYSGYIGGNSFAVEGGGSNHLCMPTDPEYTLPSLDGLQGFSLIFGTEYESTFLGTKNENAPCAVCSVSTRAEVIMIPAKTSCPADWTKEYVGYLMSEGAANHRTMFICVDEGMEAVPGTSSHMEASDLFHVEANCISLPCPPYNDTQELGCVVCTK